MPSGPHRQDSNGPKPDSPVPTEIRLGRGGRVLEVLWADGSWHSYTAPALRSACRCAECVTVRRAGRFPAIGADSALVDVQPYGPGAVNLHFGDGHRRGIYPFAYLASLVDAGRTFDPVTPDPGHA